MKIMRSNGRAMSMPAGAVFGGVCALLWTFLTSWVLAYFIHSEKLSEDVVGCGSMLILLTASILGAKVGIGKVKRQELLVAVCSGGIYLIFLLLMTALFFGGQYAGMGVTALLILGGSGVALLIRPGKGDRGGRKLNKIRRR